MKDFDTARNERAALDRTFKIGGKTFVYRASVAPEAIMKWSEFATDGDKENTMLAAAQSRLAAARTFDPPMPVNEVAKLEMKVADAAEAAAQKGKGEREWVELIDETALALIEPDYHDAWEEIRNPVQVHPLSLQDLQELMEWLIGEVVGRPTLPPSDSTLPVEGASTSSTAVSSPPEAAVSSDSLTDVVAGAAV